MDELLTAPRAGVVWVKRGHITVRRTSGIAAHGPLLVIEVQDTGAGLPLTLPTRPRQAGLAQIARTSGHAAGAAGAS